MKDQIISAQYFNKSNAEARLYHALKNDRAEKGFFIVHSLPLRMSEADFLVFSKELGILLIEMKGGLCRLENGEIQYANDQRNTRAEVQLKNCSESLEELLKDMKKENLLKKSDSCEICRWVWMPDTNSLDVTANDGIRYIYEPLRSTGSGSPDSSGHTFFTYDQNIKQFIYETWKNQISGNTRLTDDSADNIIKKLNPRFTVRHTDNWGWKRTKALQEDLCARQNALLEMLKNQRRAIFQGGAGTGKSVLALEKAAQLAENGNNGRIDWICFNIILRDHTEKEFATRYPEISDRVHFTNLYKKLSVDYNSEKMPQEKLAELIRKDMPFKNVIIDEAQDFDPAVLDALFASAEENGGVFYAFYDKNQQVQFNYGEDWLAEKHPATARIVLTKNLRNTDQIAESAAEYAELPEEYRNPGLPGKKPRVWFASGADSFECVETILKDYKNRASASDGANAPKNTVILTMKAWKDYENLENISIGENTLEKDPDHDFFSDGNILFTTVRKFKGMEADSVIVIDAGETIINKKSHNFRKGKQLFYTACSRACLFLDVVITADPKKLRAITGAEGDSVFDKIADTLKMERGRLS